MGRSWPGWRVYRPKTSTFRPLPSASFRQVLKSPGNKTPIRRLRSRPGLPLDGTTFRAWAKLMHRRSDDLLVDALIAATAVTHQLVVATRNVRDFEALGLETFNPFDVGSAT